MCTEARAVTQPPPKARRAGRLALGGVAEEAQAGLWADAADVMSWLSCPPGQGQLTRSGRA